MSGSTDEASTVVAAGQALLAASKTAPLATIRQLLKDGAPAWYQDDALGWSCLHYASERRDPKILEALLRGGAVWSAVDEWGRTAGEVCLSMGWEEGWEIIRNEGVRTGMFACHTPTGASYPHGGGRMTVMSGKSRAHGQRCCIMR